MKKILLFLAALFFIVQSSNELAAQNYLQIINPDWGWWGEPGTIDHAELTVKPKGIFMEYGLYLTFSTEGISSYSPQDSLEVELEFTLPENSIVHDSWLWIEDEIIQAEIMDEWTAGQIYNDIVGRNLDPSILFDREYYYELRVFPILLGEMRRVKLTYLVPANWSSNSVTAELPFNILNTSYYDLEKLDLTVYSNEKWGAPAITNNPDIEFTTGTDSVFGEYYFTEIGEDLFNQANKIKFNSPLENGMYLGLNELEEEKFYQLVVLPSEILGSASSKKVMVLVDYSSSNSSYSKTEIVGQLKSGLMDHLNDVDSFNVAFSKLEIERLSENWIPADSASIEAAFAAVSESSLGAYSNLPSLLQNGVEFINSNGENGAIVLFANTDDLMESEPANQLMQDITDLTEGEVSFHIADFQNRNIDYIYIGNQYYEGNQYLYINLSRMTGGNFYRVRDENSLTNLLLRTFQGIGGFISTFDLYTSLDNGFCYGRYTFNTNGSSAYLDVPVFQVGKFTGTSPFHVEVNGIYEDNLFSHQVEITDEYIEVIDTTLRKMWVAQYLKDLESEYPSNTIMSEIIRTSIENRVLSPHTAFICLEPSQGGEVCYDCRDDGGPGTDVETDTLQVSYELTVSAYPNPFNNQTKIRVNLPANISIDQVSLKIFDILGREVKTFAQEEIQSGSFELVWDGRNDYGQTVASGNYIFVAITPNKTTSFKLMLIK